MSDRPFTTLASINVQGPWQIAPTGLPDLKNIKLEKASQDESILKYRATILTALQELEDALAIYAAEQTRRGELAEADRNARMSLELATQDYNHGLVDFLDVLDAEQNALSTQNALAESAKAICTDLVAIAVGRVGV